MMLLDEALAAVAGSDVEDFCVLEEIFCQLFSACEHAHDVGRADQWIRIGEAHRRAAPAAGGVGVLPHALRRRPHRRRSMAGGRCGAHRGGAPVGTGSAVVARRCARPAGRSACAPGPLRGGRAVARRPRRRHRRPTVARPLAAIHLASGQTALATRRPRTRARSRSTRTSTAAAPLLALLVDVHLAADMLDDAACCGRPARRRAQSCTRATTWRPSRRWPVAGCAWRRAPGDPQACLREALAGVRPGADADGGGPFAARARQRAADRASGGGDVGGARRARGVRPAAGGPARRCGRRRVAHARRADSDAPKRRPAGC